MATNRLMHERNPFKDKKPDFKALALKYAEFRAHVQQDLKGLVHLDWKKPECIRALTWALLKDHFNLEVDIPLDRLIPTVPLRLNYILWLEDLLGMKKDIHGIDIGTGASCVYPLIGARKNGWKFVATEVDSVSVKCATKNVHDNGLDDAIKVLAVEDGDMLCDVLKDMPEKFDFCMTNPPFFGSELEAWTVKKGRPEPKSVNTASPAESIYPGGEVAFVKKMIQDSIELRDKVRIYTSMLGKKSSIQCLKEELLKHKITNFGLTEFCQGRTTRWGLGWTFDDSVVFPKPPSKMKKSKIKSPVQYEIPKPLTLYPDLTYSLDKISGKVHTLLEELKIMYEPETMSPDEYSLQILAKENTWSHQRRKRRMAAQKEASASPSKPTENECVDKSRSRKRSVEDTAAEEEPLSKAPKLDPHEHNDPNTKPGQAKTTGTETSNVSEVSVDTEMSIDDVESFLFKSMVFLKKQKSENILMEVQFLEGDINSSYQVVQYFKNHLK